MKNITIKTAVAERNAVMGDYGISPESTGWTLNERNDHTIRIHNACRTRRQARAMWLETFMSHTCCLEAEQLRFTDRWVLEIETE